MSPTPTACPSGWIHRLLCRAAMLAPALALACLHVPTAAQDKGSLNMLCSVELEWCALMSQVFTRDTGIKVNMIRKSTGEVLAQLTAEKDNPKNDVWFGGTVDPHVQAAEMELTLPQPAPQPGELHDWALQVAQVTGNRAMGVYLGPLGLAYNTEVLARKKIEPPA
jgi:iron(III) transport system substrate-binding protein